MEIKSFNENVNFKIPFDTRPFEVDLEPGQSIAMYGGMEIKNEGTEAIHARVRFDLHQGFLLTIQDQAGNVLMSEERVSMHKPYSVKFDGEKWVIEKQAENLNVVDCGFGINPWWRGTNPTYDAFDSTEKLSQSAELKPGQMGVFLGDNIVKNESGRTIHVHAVDDAPAGMYLLHIVDMDIDNPRIPLGAAIVSKHKSHTVKFDGNRYVISESKEQTSAKLASKTTLRKFMGLN